MNDDNMLSTIYGQISALYDIPLLQPSTPWAGWQAAYKFEGLGFGSSRQDAECLRRLVASGYLVTSGMTQGKAFKLTRLGVVAGVAFAGTAESAIRDRLAQIVKLEDKSKVCHPGTDNQLVMGFELVPGAGDWWKDASKTAAAWQVYTHNLCGTLATLSPLAMLGCIQMLPSRDGRIWGVHTTDAGRELLDAWRPNAEAVENDDLIDAYCAGFDGGISRFNRQSPARFSGVVGCCIPASQWAERGRA